MGKFPRDAPAAFLHDLARVGDDQRERRHVAPAGGDEHGDIRPARASERTGFPLVF